MAIKQVVSLTTLAGTNEQTGVAPITVTTTGTSREYRELGGFQRAVLFLDVSAASGTNPSLTVGLQVQDPVSQKWSQAALFAAQAAATGSTPISPVAIELYGLNYRANWTVSGASPSFTFSFCAVAGTEEPII